MNHGPPSPPASPDLTHPPSFWARIRVTFGPALVGLVGGALTGAAGLNAVPVLLKNCATTYAKFPSLTPPWLAGDFSVPPALLLPLLLLGWAAPFAMGLCTAWLVQARDGWGDLSAGVTTALAASLSSYAALFGWMVVTATVIVPSIADLTVLGEATKAPPALAGQPAPHPADILVERYPDLREAAPDERGGLVFAKSAADQVVGSAYGVWLGVALSMATCGQLGLYGTLLGGWLLRRGGAAWSVLIRYTELTVATGVAAGRLAAAHLGSGYGLNNGFGVSAATCLVGATALVVIAVVRRWPWPLRAHVALVWFLVLTQAGLGGSGPWPVAGAAYLAYGLLGLMLLRQRLLHRPSTTLAAA